MRFDFTRARVIAMTRVHHALFSLSSLYFGGGGTWHGTIKDGWYAYSNGSGDRTDFAWSPRGMVILVFDHESSRSQFDRPQRERTPLRYLPGVTGAAKKLAIETAVGFEDSVTAGAWTAGTTLTLSDPPGSKHMELIAGFGLPPEQAVFGKGGWFEQSSLSEAHARTAIRLAAGATELTAVEEEALFVLPDGCTIIDLADAQQVKKDLAALGVRWQIPRKRILAMQAARRASEQARIESAMGTDERALFEAVRTDDARKVTALLAAGVSIDLRTVKDQWPYTPVGDTLLIQACKAKAARAARVLLRRGADPNARNSFEQTGLMWAVRSRVEEIVAACLEAGGDPNLVANDGNAPLFWAAAEGDTKIAFRLIASGAKIDHRNRHDMTAVDVAERRGRRALVRRLNEAFARDRG